MAGKSTAGDAPATTDLTGILARLDVLEGHVADLKGLIKDGEAITDLTSKVEELAATVASHTETLAADTATLLDGEVVEGFDFRGELLKAFRQIESIAAHSNIQLPA